MKKMKTNDDFVLYDPDIIKKSAAHSGDCSCYKPNCRICDCGALRAKVSSDEIDGNSDVWFAWSLHLEAIDNSCLFTI